MPSRLTRPSFGRKTKHKIEYFADFTLTRRTKNFGAAYKEKVEPRVKISGASVWRNEMVESLGTLNKKGFTPTSFKIINQLKTIPPDRIDLIFRLVLLRTLLQKICPASSPMNEGFQPILDRLDNSQFPWVAYRCSRRCLRS